MSSESHMLDTDIAETEDWLAALDGVVRTHGPERAQYLLTRLVERLRRGGYAAPVANTTPYANTLAPHEEARNPGDPAIEWRIRSYIRWNALAMVARANKDSDLGGHIASFASSATLYDVGFNHFWRGSLPGENGATLPGDLVYIQGHSSPGVYARAFLEGRLDAAMLDRFRQEASGPGLSSYPHPRLMPEFWQFPTVSMGLGPITGIYQARMQHYLEARGLIPRSDRRIWCMLGDGECDEPETLGALALAGREKLDNLIFVVNCTLQRLDGPVRGNGKIIQELESDFRGAGWNVIKVVWGGNWDPLFARDAEGLLQAHLDSTLDGEFQDYRFRGGAYSREAFFGKHPALKAMVAHMSDDDIWRLNRGGHDPQKVYAAYARAMQTRGQPTVILAKTIKGYGTGSFAEATNPTHQQKKPSAQQLLEFRERFHLPLSVEQAEQAQYLHFEPDSPEARYLQERRAQLGGPLPRRDPRPPQLRFDLAALQSLGTVEREVSTTMVAVRAMDVLTRDKTSGAHVVPIVADEARTFGMESMFRSIGIYAPFGQKYAPQDRDQFMYYREDARGQLIEEGITEAGALSSWIAAGTAHSHLGTSLLPMFIYYAMFGFQRVGDLIWAAADAGARGFLLGATAGRSSLAGEGLQHQDGSSLLTASTVPNCRAYDPAYAYEVIAVLQDGIAAMYERGEQAMYYLTLYNEKYEQLAGSPQAAAGAVRGVYELESDPDPQLQLIASGALLHEARFAAAELRGQGYRVRVISAPGINQAVRSARAHARARMGSEVVGSDWLSVLLGDLPTVMVSDWVRAYMDQLRPFLPGPAITLGTDGFGRSDTRPALRGFFEISREHIAAAAHYLLGKDVAQGLFRGTAPWER